MSGTSPDSVSYPSQPYGLLGPYPWQTINVQDYLATGDGVTDDGPRFQLALDALEAAGGGVLIIPPAPSGVYLIGQCLRHPSYIVVRGSGAAAKLKMPADFVPASDYGGTGMWLNQHSESDETSFSGYRDFGISFENVWFDLNDAPSGGYHALFHRAVQRLRVLNCWFTGGGDGTACVTCDDVVIDGCTAVEQLNCCYDHWGGSTNCRVVNSYASVSAASVSQIVNFNGIRTNLGDGPSEVWVADGFVLDNCDLFGNASQKSISLEILGTGNSFVKNVRITGNRIYNGRIVMANNTSGVLIEGNEFTYANGDAPCVWARTNYGGDASFVSVIGNQFRDCFTLFGRGIIDTTADDTTVIGNTSIDCTYDYGVYFRSGAARGVYLGNNLPDAAIQETQGAWSAGNDVYAAQEQHIGWRTSNNVPAYVTVDGTDTLYLVGVSAADGPRSLFSCTMRSDTSSFIFYPNLVSQAFFRQSVATGLVSTGTTRLDAYAITANENEFTAVASGTGCILPANIAGSSIVIWNAGANDLSVYPVTGNQIDALGTNNPDTIAAGSSKRYTAMTNGFYRTAP